MTPNNQFKKAKHLFDTLQYQAALDLFQTISNDCKEQQLWQAYIKSRIREAECHWSMGKQQQAMKHLDLVLEDVDQYPGEHEEEIYRIYNNKGYFYSQWSMNDIALEYHYKTLKGRQTLLGETHIDTVISYINIGYCYFEEGEHNKSEDYLQKGLAIQKQTQRAIHKQTARIYNNLAALSTVKMNFHEAVAHYQKALYIYKNTPLIGSIHPETALAHDNLGEALLHLEKYDEAIQHTKTALNIHIQLKTPKQGHNGQFSNSIGGCYINLAGHYIGKRNYTKGLSYSQKALAIALEVLNNNNPVIAVIYANIGVCYQEQGNFTKAIAFHQKSLEINKIIYKNKDYYLGINYLNIALCFYESGKYQQTLFFCTKSLQNLVIDYNNNDIYSNPGIQNYNSAQDLLETLHTKSSAFYLLYINDNHKLVNLKASLNTLLLCIQLIHQLQNSSANEANKLFLRFKAQAIYREVIAIAMIMYRQTQEIDYHYQPFHYAEQAKSTILLASLQEASAKNNAGLPPELLEQEKNLRLELTYLDKRMMKEKIKGEQANEKMISEWQSRYFDQKEQYETLITHFETQYPRYYDLKYNHTTITVTELQTLLKKRKTETTVKANEAIISYFVGKSRIFSFVITADHYHIEVIQKPSDLADLIQNYNRKTTNAIFPSQFVPAAYRLYELLFQPLEAHLKGIDKLYILRDDVLHQLSFEALVQRPFEALKPREQAFTTLPYLLRKYAITYHYSATLLARSWQQETPTIAEVSFGGFAPVEFGSVAPKQAVTMVYKKGDTQARTMRSNSAGKNKLNPLPQSKSEVNAIFDLFKKQQKTAHAYLYGAANKTNLMQNAQQFRYLLLATHGFAENTEQPLSGIYLAPTNSEVTAPETFYVTEAYNLSLRADLVVISACKGGLGHLQIGEGMKAFNRGLLYAGAANVIFSTFEIEDGATRKLTLALFKNILDGQDYATALQNAQLLLMHNKSFALPCNWAGFSHVGR